MISLGLDLCLEVLNYVAKRKINYYIDIGRNLRKPVLQLCSRLPKADVTEFHHKTEAFKNVRW